LTFLLYVIGSSVGDTSHPNKGTTVCYTKSPVLLSGWTDKERRDFACQQKSLENIYIFYLYREKIERYPCISIKNIQINLSDFLIQDMISEVYSLLLANVF
jgi:hypothetical protein